MRRVIDYLNERLGAFDYEAIGEFHAFGADIETPVIQQMIAYGARAQPDFAPSWRPSRHST